MPFIHAIQVLILHISQIDLLTNVQLLTLHVEASPPLSSCQSSGSSLYYTHVLMFLCLLLLISLLPV